MHQKLAAEKQRRLDENKLAYYKPYPKQLEFHNKWQTEGSVYVYERLFKAGNQLGKTMSGAAEMAYHLTGLYPDWWEGRKWSRPIKAIAGSETSELTRDGVQQLLIGPPAIEALWGTGFIPKAHIVEARRRQGVADAIDSVVVKHVSGGTSVLMFKSYDQGRAKWQATTVDVVWFDEEPPADVYSEGKTRTNATQGSVYLTFTPLKGMSQVVKRFLNEPDPHRAVINMTIYEALHYTREQADRIISSYPEHERAARTEGIPMMGSGMVFPIDFATITIPPVHIPDYWPRIGGLDFGWDHPTAAVELAWNRDTDEIFLIREHRQSRATPMQHAAILRHWGPSLPWAWPHDGLQTDKGSGQQLAVQYKKEGLRMLGDKAEFSDGSNGVEAGLTMMLDRMRCGKFKVFSTCPLWLEEARMYHRDEGKLVKIDDDLISASRYAMMMLRHARIPRKDSGPFGYRWGSGVTQYKEALGTGEVVF